MWPSKTVIQVHHNAARPVHHANAIVTKTAAPMLADLVIAAPVIEDQATVVPVTVEPAIAHGAIVDRPIAVPSAGQGRAAMANVHPKAPAQELAASAAVLEVADLEDVAVEASAQAVPSVDLAPAARNFDRPVVQWPDRHAMMAGSMNESLAWSTNSMQSYTSYTLCAASIRNRARRHSRARPEKGIVSALRAWEDRAACKALRAGSMVRSLAASVRLAAHRAVRAPAVHRANGIALRRRAATDSAAAIATMMTTMIAPAAASANAATRKAAFNPTPPCPSRNQRSCL